LGLSSSSIALGSDSKKDHALVIERYTMPTEDNPDGELVIVCDKKVLHKGVLPYINGNSSERGYPFIKQHCISMPGMFFGVSVLERCIPIQRAYNAIKNRKHEFLNRIAMGVLAVEDGSVDVGNLEEEGLSPGKILLYRQGSSPPAMLNLGTVPPEFSAEEDRLFGEFVSVSGVSEIMRNSINPTGVTSGIAIRLLIEMDETRLSMTAEHIKSAIRRMGQHIIRLYKQFASQKRMDKAVGDDGMQELVAWSKSDLSSDDIIFETESELSNTPAARQSVLLDLLGAGLLNDQDGRLSNAVRRKILDTLGFNNFAGFFADEEEVEDIRSIEELMGELDGEGLLDLPNNP